MKKNVGIRLQSLMSHLPESYTVKYVEGFDEALIGLDIHNQRLVYSIPRAVNILMQDGATKMEAKNYMSAYILTAAPPQVGEPIWLDLTVDLPKTDINILIQETEREIQGEASRTTEKKIYIILSAVCDYLDIQLKHFFVDSVTKPRDKKVTRVKRLYTYLCKLYSIEPQKAYSYINMSGQTFSYHVREAKKEMTVYANERKDLGKIIEAINHRLQFSPITTKQLSGYALRPLNLN